MRSQKTAKKNKVKLYQSPADKVLMTVTWALLIFVLEASPSGAGAFHG